jgi:hypothetical protein
LGGLLEQQLVEAVATREQDLVMREVLTEDQLDELILEADLAQPPQVARRPRRAGTVEDQARRSSSLPTR